MKKSSTYARKLLYVLLATVILLVSAHLIMQYLNLEVYQEKNGLVFELSNRLDLDDEISLPTWVSSIVLFLTGVSALFCAYLERTTAKRHLWSLIGILGMVLSVDEVASAHEFALQSLHNVFYLNASPEVSRNAWWLVAPVIVAAGLVLAWHVIRQLPKKTWILMVVGGGVYLGGAVLVDVLAAVKEVTPFIKQGLVVAVEEGCELLGSSIILYAIANYLESKHGKVISGAIRQLKQS